MIMSTDVVMVLSTVVVYALGMCMHVHWKPLRHHLPGEVMVNDEATTFTAYSTYVCR